MFGRLPLQGRNLNQLASSESSSSGMRSYVPGNSDPHSSGLRPHCPVERKWALGLQVLHIVHFTALYDLALILMYHFTNSLGPTLVK